MAAFVLARARSFVARLQVDAGRARVCRACLSFVSFPLGEGDERRADRPRLAAAADVPFLT